MQQLNQEKQPDSSNHTHQVSNSLKSSPRGLHTSLEGGLDDVDLLSICKATPIDQIVDKVVGKLFKLFSLFEEICTEFKYNIFRNTLL